MTALHLNTRRILSDAVEAGCRHGVRRFWKHRDDGPGGETLDRLAEQVAESVMQALGEVIDFDQGLSARDSSPIGT